MRNEWTIINDSLRDLNGIELDLEKLTISAKLFYNACIMKNNDENNLYRLFESKTYLETCLTILKSLVEPNDNELIESLNLKYQSYDYLEVYYGNFMAILDSEIKELKTSIRNERFAGNTLIKISIKSLAETLMDYMENLVLLPLTNAYKQFLKKKEKVYKNKDHEIIDKHIIFEYILLKEILTSAKIKGSGERKKVSMSGTASSMTLHETNISKAPRNVAKAFQESNPGPIPPELEDFDEIHFDDNF